MSSAAIRPDQIESMKNVTVESLARQVGVLEGSPDLPDEIRSRFLKMQLGLLQSKPRIEQDKIHHEFAAKYLPVLAEKYRQSSGPLNAPMIMLNVVSHTSYFIRFLQTPAAQGIASIQAKRMAQDSPKIEIDTGGIGEICQFLSTLLVLQGVSEVAEDDKRLLLHTLTNWKRKGRGTFAGDTSERCLDMLANDMVMRAMAQQMKKHLEACISQCGAPGCTNRLQSSGSQLMQCAKCKTALYCGSEHQRLAWNSHKYICVAPTF